MTDHTDDQLTEVHPIPIKPPVDLRELLEDIIASSDANDGDSLMNAIEAAKTALR